MIYYINGIRFKNELEATRRLRHKIVHEGLRLEQTLSGSVLRAVETTTWLFNWFHENRNRDFTRCSADGGYGLKSALRGYLQRWAYEIGPDGVRVLFEKPDPSEARLSDDLITEQWLNSHDAEKHDLELFTSMAFQRLGFDAFEDAVPDDETCFHGERFLLHQSGAVFPVFLIDTPTSIDVDDLGRIAATLRLRSCRGMNDNLALCIVNHQCGVDWRMRDSLLCSEAAEATSRLIGIALIGSADLVMLARLAEEHSWSVADIRTSLLSPGRQGRIPPGASLIGHAVHFFDRASALSVQLVDNATLRVGDQILIRTHDRFVTQDVTSLQINRNAVSEANGDRVGIATSLKRSEIPIGAEVLLVNCIQQ